ncbi:hypothetical protein J7L48_00680 [bacterium]|nr:hypothetical protein [bacterium]
MYIISRWKSSKIIHITSNLGIYYVFPLWKKCGKEIEYKSVIHKVKLSSQYQPKQLNGIHKLYTKKNIRVNNGVFDKEEKYKKKY